MGTSTSKTVEITPKNSLKGTPRDEPDSSKPTQAAAVSAATQAAATPAATSGGSTDDTVEADVGSVSDMKDGEMKAVAVGDGKVLLVRDGGEFHAVGHKCTHYGAPLANGVLCNGRIRCQWHGACFNVRTGDIEDFPGLDSLPKYQVEVRDSRVFVRANKKVLESSKHVKTMSCRSPDCEDTYLIIGGGCAATVAVETLRQEGFKGRVVMATCEKFLPYDRTKLSKSLDASGDQYALRGQDFYSIYDIEVLTDKEAVKMNTLDKSVEFKDGSSLQFSKLLIATGGKPRELSVPGSDLDGVCYLRTPQDANRIHSSAQEKNVVIIGNSFIGMEVAAYLVKKCVSVTVVGRSSAPFKQFGEKVGNALKQLFISKGVKFVDNNQAGEFVGEDGKLTEVVLKDGTKLPADVCVIGAGCIPSTDFLVGSDISLTAERNVVVDQCMKTNNDFVYAAGDIVQFPLVLFGNQSVNIGHWQIAGAHGRTAALNMIGKESEIRTVPYFWTMVFGKSVRYAGYGAGFDNVIIHGSLEELKFVAFYVRGANVVAVASLNFDPIVSQAAEVMSTGKSIAADTIRNDPKAFLWML